MQNKKITVIGSISQSPFMQSDIDILSDDCIVYPINIYGTLGNTQLQRIKQYIHLISITLFNIIPKIWKSDVVYIWFADVHAFLPVLISKLLHKKSIIAIGGYEVSNIPEIRYGMMRSPLTLRAKICKWVMKNADVCIVPSISYYIKTIPYANTIVYAPDCVTNYQYNKNIEKLNIVLMVGSATYDNYLLKGIPLYNKIAGQINVPFYFIGNYDDEIKEQYNNIDYLGLRSHNDVLYLMYKSKVCCQLSVTESFGVSILESMLNGCVPITTCVDDLELLVNHCGYCSNDETTLVNLIKSALNSNDGEKIVNITNIKNDSFIKMRKCAFDHIINNRDDEIC
jgi:hypothetical protein